MNPRTNQAVDQINHTQQQPILPGPIQDEESNTSKTVVNIALGPPLNLRQNVQNQKVNLTATSAGRGTYIEALKEKNENPCKQFDSKNLILARSSTKFVLILGI